MDAARRPGDGVVEQNDAAVGGEDRQREVFLIGNQAVGVIVPLTVQPLAGVGGGAGADGGLVDLSGEDQTVYVHPGAGAEAPVILPQGQISVPHAGAEIETVPGGGGDSAQTGGEGVGHGEKGGGQKDHTALFMGFKGHINLRYGSVFGVSP